MCRFLLVKSKEKIKPEKLLNQFARMCGNSRAPDGDWQGDGWGIAIKNSRLSGIHDVVDSHSSQTTSGQKWEIHKSLNPIWKDKNIFNNFPETNVFVVHARSAGFPEHRGNIEYNQPYVSDDLCFVFNGMIKGVKLEKPLAGKIGAQKIFSLIQDVILNEVKNPLRIEQVLRVVDKLIINSSKKIVGMNIGLVKGDKFYILCEYENNPSYFGIKYYKDSSVTLVCSESIGEYDWKVMDKSEVLLM